MSDLYEYIKKIEGGEATQCNQSELIKALELLPCPFWGAKPYIKSNRDTHKLQADHEADCFFDGEEMCEVPATDDYKAWMVSVWNKRL